MSSSFFAPLGSVSVKAARRMLVKLTPDGKDEKKVMTDNCFSLQKPFPDFFFAFRLLCPRLTDHQVRVLLLLLLCVCVCVCCCECVYICVMCIV